jgi:Phytanoyl-CoA dioxygenase (PhyH)
MMARDARRRRCSVVWFGNVYCPSAKVEGKGMDPNSPEFPQYWQELNPGMTICGKEPGQPVENPGADLSIVETAVQTLSTSGYFQMPEIVAGSVAEQMKRCFELTRNAGWPPVFVFVYDEFWRVYRRPILVRFLTRALGEGYHQLPYFWGHYVAANSSGWRPHADGPSALHKLTVWLALSDATLENGCMYVVRRNSDTEKISNGFLESETKSFPAGDLATFLQHTKALPVAAGSYLGWGANVVHWGSMSSPFANPRLSISAEFASCRPNPRAQELPLLEADPAAPLPTFERRLHLVASAITSYERFEVGLLRYLALAEQLLHRTAAVSSSPRA